ncbi:phytanoyl-CoA dioxygenase family protein [Paenibacillus sp. MWE-103]|uniref:Phytanoyl-CoA dioxygenase family protein n=1 Tax=Paenibacillus artemisiicola TaxID=1172618 RepID=A0ABS3WC79_9BACL|nr:phytanoyl-CoA dioxygenase family protein [Paenibacillus artemisiicola]MBO7745896.1 phytanoyl-CoA dioxygenase family protein [Paenibacillus artemisiicola]
MAAEPHQGLQAVSEPGAFTELDRFMFESWGYLVIPNVLTAEQVQACLEASVRLHEKEGTEGWAQVGRGFETEPALDALVDHPSVLPKVRALYGDRFILQSAWCTKQPAFGGFGGWHQDGSGAYDFKKLGYPVPLLQLRASYLLTDQSLPRMGNMEMIPGSHRAQVPLPPDLRKEKGDLPIGHVICAPAGSVLLFHNAVWHRTYAHDGDYDRYTMHYIYSPPWVRFSDRFANDPDYLARATPVRRYLAGEYERPDAPFGAGYPASVFDDE